MFVVLLELEQQSCQGIYALRHRFHNDNPLMLRLLRSLVYKPSNRLLLESKLPSIAASLPPFDVAMRYAHRTPEFGEGYRSVKYKLRSKRLDDLCLTLHEQLADAVVLGKGRKFSTLRQDVGLGRPRYTRKHTVTVKTNLADETETNKILEEVREIDARTLGYPKAIGLRLQWSEKGPEGKELPAEYGDLLPFLGKP